MATLAALMEAHQIPLKKLAQRTSVKGLEYSSQKTKNTVFSSSAIVIDGTGKKNNLVQALFEPKTYYSDSLTYDITSWSLPYAHGLKAVATNQSLKTVAFEKEKFSSTIDPDAYAYAAERKSIEDGKLLAALINADLRVYYNQEPITNGGKRWDRGSVFVLKGENKHLPNLAQTIKEIVEKTQQPMHALTSGFSDEGPDLGSNKMRYISNKKIGILNSDRATPASYGEIWHFFEQQLSYPLMQLSENRLNERFLQDLDVLIIPSGYYGNLIDQAGENALAQWIQKGGRIVAVANAVSSFANHEQFSLKKKSSQDDEKEVAYGDREREDIRSSIYGSIYNATVDATHPLSSGFKESYFTLKTSATAYELLDNYGTAAYLSKGIKPYAGFSGDKANKQQSESLLFGTERYGRGSVVYLVDNILFRSFWENGKLWLVNAVFM